MLYTVDTPGFFVVCEGCGFEHLLSQRRPIRRIRDNDIEYMSLCPECGAEDWKPVWEE